MDTVTILIVVGAVLVVALVAFLAYRMTRSRRLRERFGPEYERAVDHAESRRDAEEELAHREERRQELDIHELEPDARRRYQDAWAELQRRFVDEPRGAVVDADRLVGDVMRERGYPMDEFDQRAADVSVDHPQVVDNYRSAHAIAVRAQEDRADTEDLRQAVVHYRDLFEALLNGRERTS